MSGHRRLELRVAVRVAGFDEVEIAATVHLPAVDRLADCETVLVGLPGAGYSRQYYDIQFDGLSGYSEAACHVARGHVFVAIDHPGVGQSGAPAESAITLHDLAAMNHAAVEWIVRDLRKGMLDASLPPLRLRTCIGLGQSMGGFVLVAMQARHRSFDGIGVLGASMVGTVLPRPPGAPPLDLSACKDAIEVAMEMTRQTDWRYAFHWDDVAPALVSADMAGGLPQRLTAPPWGSLTMPPCVSELVMPGVVAAEAAVVDVPVLLAMGERDVCADQLAELGAFVAARDRSLYVVPRMAHMHNFAGTRARLWQRIERFAEAVGDGVTLAV